MKSSIAVAAARAASTLLNTVGQGDRSDLFSHGIVLCWEALSYDGWNRRPNATGCASRLARIRVVS